MAAVMPQTMPWTTPPRGSSDGVKDRHPAMSAPQQPGSVTYSSFRGLAGSGDGSAVSAAAVGMSVVTAASGGLSEGGDEDRLDGVQAVLGLVEDDASGRAEDLAGHFEN